MGEGRSSEGAALARGGDRVIGNGSANAPSGGAFAEKPPPSGGGRSHPRRAGAAPRPSSDSRRPGTVGPVAGQPGAAHWARRRGSRLDRIRLSARAPGARPGRPRPAKGSGPAAFGQQQLTRCGLGSSSGGRRSGGHPVSSPWTSECSFTPNSRGAWSIAFQYLAAFGLMRRRAAPFSRAPEEPGGYLNSGTRRACGAACGVAMRGAPAAALAACRPAEPTAKPRSRAVSAPATLRPNAHPAGRAAGGWRGWGLQRC